MRVPSFVLLWCVGVSASEPRLWQQFPGGLAGFRHHNEARELQAPPPPPKGNGTGTTTLPPKAPGQGSNNGTWQSSGNWQGTMCNSTQLTCTSPVYNADGTINRTAPASVSCIPLGQACPCNAQFENYCGNPPRCRPKSNPCPVSCNTTMCTSWNWTKTCATMNGCVCDPAYELPCTDSNNKTVCRDLRYYSQCPLICPPGQSVCPRVNFTSASVKVTDKVCATPQQGGDCPVLCGAGATQCGGSDRPYCTYGTCPLNCPGQRKCNVVNYVRGSSTVLNQSQVCAPSGQACPCGLNAQQCPGTGLGDDGGPRCIAASDSCPVQCSGSQRKCSATAFTPGGMINTSTAIQPTCAASGQACSCGANAASCTFNDDNGNNRTECRFAGKGCPVQCAPGQSRCNVVNYNSSGFVVNSTQTCAPFGQCPCGTNAQACQGEDKSTRCTPNVNFKTGNAMSCPIWCDYNTQSKCTIPSFDQNGVLVSSSSYCVAKGGLCDCTLGVLADNCNVTVRGKSMNQCIPLGGFCPAACPSGQVSCPQVDNFAPNGTFLFSASPSNSSSQPACAASYSQCGCGTEARACTIGDKVKCVPLAQDCPLNCPSGQKLCKITNYDTSSNVVDVQQQCVNMTDSCLCGSNAGKCPGTDGCLPSSITAKICPCSASQSTCFVDNFDENGVKTSTVPVCSPSGQPCPCGTNTISCTNPRQASRSFCLPQTTPLGPAVCPSPCTPAQEVAGNKTCVQTNLDTSGNFVSRTITCMAASNCQPGANQQLCPSGAMIFVGSTCLDLYGLLGGTASSSAVSNTSLTSTVAFTMSGKGGSAATDNVAAAMASALQLPGSMALTMQAVPVKSGSRRLQTGSAETAETYSISMQVAALSTSPVSTGLVAETAAQMISTGNPTTTAALSALGQVNVASGISASTQVETVSTPAETAVAAAQLAMATTEAPTSSTATTQAASATTATTKVGTSFAQGKGVPTAAAALVLLGLAQQM